MGKLYILLIVFLISAVAQDNQFHNSINATNQQAYSKDLNGPKNNDCSI